MEIRRALESELEDVLAVERAAFGSEEEAELVRNLLGDGSAAPVVSLLAFEDSRAVGHILFTKAGLDSDSSVSTYLLAPLAVVPEWQKKGVGGRLIEEGIKILSDQGVGIVFVLGWPDYYPRHGFTPAGEQGFEASYPIEEKNAGAWMLRALSEGVVGAVSGKVLCAEAIDRPEYWVE